MSLLSLFWICFKILLNPSIALCMPQPILLNRRGWCLGEHLAESSGASLEFVWLWHGRALSPGLTAGKDPSLGGKGLSPRVVPPLWPPDKASRHVGTDYHTVWPPKCVIIAEVPFACPGKIARRLLRTLGALGRIFVLLFPGTGKAHRELPPALTTI